ncbi:MAG: hypothetical protein OEZ44_11645 [Candidatus Bathyarchaeota archaeon]|jgi:hypothetical protein|nr:hypothetical protein [Candidatus Bathyarchaeota archaeon]
MGSRVGGSFVEPINNAARPVTLAALSMTILKFSVDDPYELRLILLLGAIMFLLSSFFIFFATLYPTRRILWTLTATTFLIGMFFSITSSILLLMIL